MQTSIIIMQVAGRSHRLLVTYSTCSHVVRYHVISYLPPTTVNSESEMKQIEYNSATDAAWEN